MLAFADGTLQDLDLKGVSFEIVHNPGTFYSLVPLLFPLSFCFPPVFSSLFF